MCHLTKNEQALQIIGKSRAFHGLLYSIIFIFSVICKICVKYAHLVHLLHFYLPQGANFQKFYSKGSILPGSACTCREKRSGKEGKHPSTSTSSLFLNLQKSYQRLNLNIQTGTVTHVKKIANWKGSLTKLKGRMKQA